MITQNIRSLKKGVAFSWQDKRIICHIRKCYPLNKKGLNKKLRTALSVYLVLTELASNCAKDRFQATNGTIAKYSAISTSTARRYMDDFIKLKVIKKELIKNGKANQANYWTLLEPSPMTFAAIQESIHNNEQPPKGSSVNIKNKGTTHYDRQPYVHHNEQD